MGKKLGKMTQKESDRINAICGENMRTEHELARVHQVRVYDYDGHFKWTDECYCSIGHDHTEG